MPGRRRLLAAAVLYAAIVAAVALSSPAAPRLRPGNSYGIADPSPRRSFATGVRSLGLYPPIPFGPTEQDLARDLQAAAAIAKPTRPAEDGHRRLPAPAGHRQHAAATCWSRMIYGTRISLTVGFVAVGIYVAVGIVPWAPWPATSAAWPTC